MESGGEPGSFGRLPHPPWLPAAQCLATARGRWWDPLASRVPGWFGLSCSHAGRGRALAAGADAAGIWELLCEDEATSLATDSLSRTSRRCFICTNDLDGSPGNGTASLPRCPLLRLFSQRLTRLCLRPPLASQITSGRPPGACTLTPSKPHTLLEPSSARSSGVMCGLHSSWTCRVLGRFQRAPNLLIFHQNSQ